MIKHLILNNLVLVDSCEIHFGPSFNVVSGETGAGKTALLEAIGLALGNRADCALIRKGCDKAFVEIAFDIETLPSVCEILDEAGIQHGPDEYLVIRREISKEGKNRAFINCRMAPLPLLQKIGAELIDKIDQHAHQALRTADAGRALVDLFGSLKEDLKAFQTTYAKERQFQKDLEGLQQLLVHRTREEDTLRYQLDEIETVALKQGEEETIFEKYQRLANSAELTEKIEMMINGLSDSQSAVLPQLAHFSKTCESLLAYDHNLSDASSLIHEAQIALTETLRVLQSCSDNLESDPKTFEYLENRLSAISRLKRKYGQSFEEIDAFRQKIVAELSRLENVSEDIKTLETSLIEAKSATDKAAATLTKKRTESAAFLAKALTAHLQMLNMSGAEVQIEIVKQPRNSFGDEMVEFWLKANTGENPALVKEHSSGGELSRLLFAIKVVLAEKNNTPTLLFDEIDANVGGKTASIIAEKLKELGKCRQVICITHFPQVAAKADRHFGVQKVESEGRTLTEIRHLSKSEREQELLRMLGGERLLSSV